MMVEQLESHIVEQQFLEQCFAKMDVNRDGTITAKEIAKTMKISNAEADELVREGDTDGDGELTFEGTGACQACNSLGIGNQFILLEIVNNNCNFFSHVTMFIKKENFDWGASCMVQIDF